MTFPYGGNSREDYPAALGNKLAAWAFGMTMRNNYMDFAFRNGTDGLPVKVLEVTDDTTRYVTLETEFPHNVKAGDFVLIEGATNSHYNGRFEVTAPAADDGWSLELTVDLRFDGPGATSGSILLRQHFPPTCRVTLTRDTNDPIVDRVIV